MEINEYVKFNTDLKKIWLRLEKEIKCTPFQTYDWCKNWFETIGINDLKLSLKIHHIETSNYEILLPFIIAKKKSMNILMWLGGNQADYMEPLFLSNNKSIYLEDVMFKIFNNIKNIDVIHLEKQSKNSFISTLNRKNFYFIKNTELSKTNLRETWEESYASLFGSKTRQTDRRKIKKLFSEGKVKFEIIENKTDLENFFNVLIKQKVRRYFDTNFHHKSTDSWLKYYKKLLSQAYPSFKVQASWIKVDQKIIAAHLGFLKDDIFYYILPSFESGKWSKYSPGRLILLYLYEWANKNNYKVFDLTIGNESYKKGWANEIIDIFDLIKPISFKGYIYLLFLNFYRKLPINSKKLIKQLLND